VKNRRHKINNKKLNRVVSALIPWVATQNTPACFYSSFDNAMLFNGLDAIFGTGGIKTAIAVRKKKF